MAFTPDEDDLNYTINDLQDLHFNMEQAIRHVFNNEYILLVGSEVILKPSVHPSGDVNDYILHHMNRQMKSRYKSFDEVINHSGNDIDPIRNFLYWDKFRKGILVDDVSDELQGLLRTKLFKVVITTTFDCYLEILLRDIWEKNGYRLRVVNIWDASSLEKFYNCLTEYRNPKDYNEPTLIYAFGKCENKEGNYYARKDFEYIQTIEHWLEFNKRDNLMMQFILSKRLLSLGCKFDDWYFRFFWYILRRDEMKQREGDIAIAFDREDRSDQNLEAYLKNSRVITQTEITARDFIHQVTCAFTSTDLDNPYHDLVLKYRRRGQIFLSYCNKDKLLARKIFLQLHSLYPNLWFDQEVILGGDNYDREIEYGISHAKIFIPLLTPAIAADLQEGRLDNYYNKEWRTAVAHKGQLTIIPLATDGFSARENYYQKFEEIFGNVMSCINLTDSNAFSSLQKSIDKHLSSNEQE